MTERESLHDRLAALVEEMVDRGILCEDACLQFERHYLRTVLDRCHGNLSKAAEELRLHRNTLAKRLKAAEARPAGPKATPRSSSKARGLSTAPKARGARRG